MANRPQIPQIFAEGESTAVADRRYSGRQTISAICGCFLFDFHAGSFSVMSMLQCGQGIFSPMAWAGNSICPWQKKQDVFKRSGLRRVMLVWQCGQGIFRPRLRSENRIWIPQEGQDIFRNLAAFALLPSSQSQINAA